MTARRLSALFNVEPGEGRLVALMLACSFLVGSSATLAGTAAYTLFVSGFGAQRLPYVYMAMGLVVTASSLGYLRLSRRLSFTRLLVVAGAFALLVLVGARMGLALTTALVCVFVLPICSELASSLTTIAFWNLAGRLFNLRQGKRLFGLLGGGWELAKAAGGFAIPALVLWLGTANLLLLAAAGVAGALGLILVTMRSYSTSLAAPADERGSGTGRSSASAWWRNRYIVLVLGLFALLVAAWCTLDVVFYDQAAVQFSDEDRLASFLGMFFGIVGLLNLLGRSFLTAPLLRRHGVRIGLLLTPAILLGTGILTVAIDLALGAIAALFWLVVLMRLLFDFFTNSVDYPVLNVLYQPLPAAQRMEVQALVDGVAYSVSVGLSGLVLWALTALWHLGTIPLWYVLLVVVVAWAAIAVLLGREYPQRLTQALAKRRLGGAGLSLIDSSTLAVLQRELRSPSPGAVTYALTLLETLGREPVAACLPALVEHPSPDVRQEALGRIERLRVTEATAAVRQRMAVEGSPAVLGTAVCTLAALAGAAATDWVSPYLHHAEPEVRRGAAVGLLRYGRTEGALAARSSVLQMAASSEPSERMLAAQVLGDAGAQGFYRPLLPLLQDESRGVQRAALSAAGRLKSAPLWPLVVEGLDSPPVRGAAVSALVSGGAAVLPVLFASFDAAAAHPQLRRRLVSVSGRIGGEQAVAWLKAHLSHPDANTRTQILHALCRSGYQAGADEAPHVVEQIKAEAALATRFLATQADLSREGPNELLHSALESALAQCRTRLLYLLSFLYDRQLILQVRDTLSLGSADRRAYAIETLDVLVSPDRKRLFFPLLSDSPPDWKSRQMGAQYPQRTMSRQDRLEEVIASPLGQAGAWVQACALYAACATPATAPAEAIACAASSPDPLVREMARWASTQLKASQAARLAGCPQPDQPRPTGGAGLPKGSQGIGEESMLTTVEKVIALKKAEVFAEVPDEILADLAPCLEAVEYLAGQAVFHQGEPGDCMYIVFDGNIRIHEGPHTWNELGPGEVFGEMAVLDAEPRSASATATVDTLLLRLDQDALYEVMADRIEVAQGIVRTLCRRLRARMGDLSRLRLEPKG